MKIIIFLLIFFFIMFIFKFSTEKSIRNSIALLLLSMKITNEDMFFIRMKQIKFKTTDDNDFFIFKILFKDIEENFYAGNLIVEKKLYYSIKMIIREVNRMTTDKYLRAKTVEETISKIVGDYKVNLSISSVPIEVKSQKKALKLFEKIK